MVQLRRVSHNVEVMAPFSESLYIKRYVVFIENKDVYCMPKDKNKWEYQHFKRHFTTTTFS